MGNYNPHKPQILGQEWVPIRNEVVVFSPAVNASEIGHGFTLSATRTIQDARTYLQNPPVFLGQVFVAAIYPAGTEDLSGPVRTLLIPVNAGAITGAGITTSDGGTVAAAVAAPGDGRSLIFQNGVAASRVSFFFATTQTPPYNELAGKRVLGLRLHYIANGLWVDTTDELAFLQGITNTLSIERDNGQGVSFTGLRSGVDTLIGGISTGTLQRRSFGEINYLWTTTSPHATTDRMPWRHDELLLFEASSGVNRIHVEINLKFTTGSDVGTLSYLALEVLFCEERRLIYGARAFGGSVGSGSTGVLSQSYVTETNVIPMRDTSFVANSSLPAGSYTLTLSSADQGDYIGSASSSIFRAPNQTQSPDINATRELYSIPSHPGALIFKPFPIEDHIGDTFTATLSHILPQLSLHTPVTGAPVPEEHVYGRQVAAHVYGSPPSTPTNAVQDIERGPLSVNASFTQVRFYARRFGDTTVPLTLSGLASSAAITRAQFDVLPEIVDGWREVTLRLNVPAVMGTSGTETPWTWSAVGEEASNRWEILGASAPAISGVTGNFFALSPQQLYTATYAQPVGDLAELTWAPGYGAALPLGDDDASDAVLIFSQDPLTVTGVGVSLLSQPVSGIGQECGVTGLIPSAIQYLRITWGLPVNAALGASDNFNRVVAPGGWGTASDGKTWTPNAGSVAADFQVNGERGVMTPSITAVDNLMWVDVGGPDQDIIVELQINGTSEGTGSLRGGVIGRLTDASNLYYCELRYTLSNTCELRLRKRVAGVQTDLQTVQLPQMLPAPTAIRMIRLQIEGSYIRGKVWDTSVDGPNGPEWQATAVDTSLPTGNNAGCMCRDDTTAAGPTSFFFDNFDVGVPDFNFGFYELQRRDTVDTVWKTIMRATRPEVTAFNDYEARVDVVSSYQIRTVNVLNFAGPWSVTGTGTIPAPGVTLPPVSASKRGVLIFTSNESQVGAHNLAYVMTWDGPVTETFEFVEASTVDVTMHHDRDFQVMHHGTERGGETFTRTLLVANAAVALPRLGNVRSLRDMAWADLAYVCVRDDIGDRWLAAVVVPDDVVRRNRRLYNTTITVIEVTDTPSPVNP